MVWSALFTGIIQHVGRVTSARRTRPGQRLAIDAGPLAADVMEGSSIAVDGVCLTVCALDGRQLSFDVVAETLDRSTLGRMRVDDRVNLEPALRADALASAGMLSLDRDTAEELAEAALCDLRTGSPIPPFTTLREEARDWATFASRGELRAYLGAIWNRLPGAERASFLNAVRPKRTAAA